MKIRFTFLFVTVLALFLGCSDDDSSSSRDQFIATYSSVDNCPSGVINSVFTITASAAGDNAVLITNLLGLMQGTGLPAVNATVSGDNISIPNQNFAFQLETGTVSGSGSLNGRILNLTITYSFRGVTETCGQTASKQ